MEALLEVHYFNLRLTDTDLMTPPVGMKEDRRTKRSLAFTRSQSMLHTARRHVISSVAVAVLSNSAHLWSNLSGRITGKTDNEP